MNTALENSKNDYILGLKKSNQQMRDVIESLLLWTDTGIDDVAISAFQYSNILRAARKALEEQA